MSNVSKISDANSNEREFFRVDGQVYLHVDPINIEQGTKHEAHGLYVPTSSLDEDDIVGLSIDAFREELVMSGLDNQTKDYFLKMQQMMSMMKRFMDAEMLGRKQKLFKKINVNISGSGLSYSSPVPFVVGQNLRMAMFFPRFPYTYICVIGEVLKCEKVENDYLIRTHYKGISEKNQDEILRFVNQCQRDSRKR